ncbi:MAG: hypothetical protein WC989_00400 [Micavibrio sp.]
MPANETRILHLPSLSRQHAIVSMPKTDWFWLDDYVRTHYPYNGYKALLREFHGKASSTESLFRLLRSKAKQHCGEQMATLYGLVNDNTPSPSHAAGETGAPDNPSHPAKPDYFASMPFAYRLFHFLPHPTHLTTVWERKNYHLYEGNEG